MFDVIATQEPAKSIQDLGWISFPCSKRRGVFAHALKTVSGLIMKARSMFHCWCSLVSPFKIYLMMNVSATAQAPCSLVGSGHGDNGWLWGFRTKIRSWICGGVHPLLRKRSLLGLASWDHWPRVQGPLSYSFSSHVFTLRRGHTWPRHS